MLLWWVVLFTVLPWGVASQLETKDVMPGSEPGAPRTPRLARKALVTTAITCLLWLIVYFALAWHLVSFDSFLRSPSKQ